MGAERLGDDDQEVDVAASRHDVIERERTVQDHRHQRLCERVRTPRREPGREGEGAETLVVGHEARWRSSASYGANSGQPIWSSHPRSKFATAVISQPRLPWSPAMSAMLP